MKKYLFPAFIFLSCFLASHAYAAISFVQATSTGAVTSSGCNGGLTTCTKSFGSSVTAGDLIVFWGTWGSGSGSLSASDNQGDSFTCPSAAKAVDGTNTQTSQMCYALNAKGGSTTVSSTFPSGIFNGMMIFEYSGVASYETSTFNIANGTTATDNVNSGVVTTSNNGDLIVGGVLDDGSTAHFTSGTGQNNRINITSAQAISGEDYTQSLSGTASSTWTLSAADRYIAIMMAFVSQASLSTVNATHTVTVVTSPTLSVSNIILNGGNAITLTPATTTAISVVASTTEVGGGPGISYATGTIYRTSLGTSCSANKLNCYQIASSSCVFTGSTTTVTCTANIWYFADSTGNSSSSFPPDSWKGAITLTDGSSTTSTAISSGVNINVLSAINITTSSINYGTVLSGANTGATNQSITVQNAGNSSTSIEVQGTALTFGINTLATSSQHYSSSTFTFGGSEPILSDTATTIQGFILTDPTSTAAVQGNLYWGLSVAGGATNGTYSGTITLTANFFTAGQGSTPTFVSETSKNSTLTNALTTNPNGQIECPNYSYCLPYAEPALAGNFGIVPFTYSTGTVFAATASDDASDTYTCLTGSKDSGTSEWNGLCYAPNLTAGAHKVTISFGTGKSITEVSAKAAMFYNIATSTPVDASGTAAGASSSTVNAVTITTNQGFDLVYVYVCRTDTPNTTSFTAGSGFTLITEDVNDGCATEYEVATSSATITPTMTMSSASGYTEFVVAFKSGSTGTPPSGWYLDRLTSWSSPTVSGSQHFQFTTSGDLLFNSNSCGGTLEPSSITDSINTWKSTGGINLLGGLPVDEFYVSNATSNATGTLTVSTTGTGDCTFTFYDFTGAPTSTVIGRALFETAAAHADGSTSTVTWDNTLEPIADSNPMNGSFLPDPSNGIVLAVGGQVFNTTIGFAAPTSTCDWDGASYGGMPLDGPEPIDQNNTWGHCYFTSTGQPKFTFKLSSSTEDPSTIEGDLVGIWGSSGTGIINEAQNEVTSNATLNITVATTTSGNLLAVSVMAYTASGAVRTVSSVCLDGTTCAAGNAFTQLANATSSGTVGTSGETEIWYLLNAPSGKNTVTVTLSGSAPNLEGMYEEVQKGSGAAWATDGGGHVSNGAASGTIINGASLTTTGSIDFCIAHVAMANRIGAAPAPGNEFTYGNAWFDKTADGTVSLLTTTAGIHTPQWTDQTSGGAFSESTGCFK